MARLAEKGTQAVIVMTADPDGAGPDTPLKTELRGLVRAHGIRLIGPGSIGVQAPWLGLNASAIKSWPKAGNLALLSQSGSVAASVEWASRHGIGFSHVVTTGDGLDVGLADLLDYFAGDMRTSAVLMYVRSVSNGQAFLSAARATARIKPVIAIKPRDSASTRFDGLPDVCGDAIYDAAFQRSGMLRVDDVGEWFDAVESLGYGKRPTGDTLAILSNGGSLGQLAAVPLAAQGRLMNLCADTAAALSKVVPKRWQVGNPLDLGRDATADRYAKALQAVLADPERCAALVIYAPSLLATPQAVARAVADVAKQESRPVIACWMGQSDATVRSIFAEARVPLYDTPEKAARAFLHLVNYRQNQQALMELPSARSFGGGAAERRDGATLLTRDEEETPEILRAYGIVVRAIMNEEPEIEGRDGLAIMAAYGFATPAAGGAAALERLPIAISVADDPAFGRVIQISGAGRHAIALPPLNPALCERQVAEILGPIQSTIGCAVDAALVQQVLVRLGDLLVALPELEALEIPWLGLDGRRLVVPEVRMRVAAHELGKPHLAIRPYPHQLEERTTLKSGRGVLIRPLRPEDEVYYRDMLAHVAPHDLFLRFCSRFGGEANSIPRDLLAKLIHIDYDRDMTFIALAPGEGDRLEALGVVDALAFADRSEAEYSIMLRSDLKGTGLGKLLMERIIAYCRAQKFGKVVGMVLKNNQPMRNLCRRLGFICTSEPDDDMVTLTLPLES